MKEHKKNTISDSIEEIETPLFQAESPSSQTAVPEYKNAEQPVGINDNSLLHQKLQDYKIELEKLEDLRQRFGDENLIIDINDLKAQIHQIEQQICPDSIVEFSSELGPLTWNQTKRLVEVDGMTFTHEELLLMQKNQVKLSPLEMELKRIMKAKLIAVTDEEFNNNTIELKGIKK